MQNLKKIFKNIKVLQKIPNSQKSVKKKEGKNKICCKSYLYNCTLVPDVWGVVRVQPEGIVPCDRARGDPQFDAVRLGVEVQETNLVRITSDWGRFQS